MNTHTFPTFTTPRLPDDANDCAEFDDNAYFVIFLLAAVGWALCFIVSLPLLITYWVLYKGRVKAEAELIAYKFSEQREVLRVPQDTNPKTAYSGPSHSQAMAPSIQTEPDPFLNPQQTTYRPPTGVANDSKQRWLEIKNKN